MLRKRRGGDPKGHAEDRELDGLGNQEVRELGRSGNREVQGTESTGQPAGSGNWANLVTEKLGELD